MTHDELIKRLRSYKCDKAHVEVQTVRLAEVEAQIAKAENAVDFELAGPKASVVTGMPHGTRVSDGTADTAMRAIVEKEKRTAMLKKQAENIKRDIAETKPQVDELTEAFGALTAREKFVVCATVCDGESWRRTNTAYEIEFREYISFSSIQRLKSNGLAKLMSVLKME